MHGQNHIKYNAISYNSVFSKQGIYGHAAESETNFKRLLEQNAFAT